MILFHWISNHGIVNFLATTHHVLHFGNNAYIIHVRVLYVTPKTAQIDNTILTDGGDGCVCVCVKFKATAESDETTTTAVLMTTVSQQTSAADSSPSTVADDTTTVTDSQTQTSQSHILARIYS